MASHYVTQELVELVASLEGFSATPYKGAGEKYYTIGYGHYGSDVRATDSWTEEYAKQVLTQELQSFATQVDSVLEEFGWDVDALTNNQWNALVSYCYNRGAGNSTGTNGLRQLIKNTPVDNTIVLSNNFLVYWGTNTSAKTGLLVRRNKEQVLFNTPDGSSTPATSVSSGTGSSTTTNQYSSEDGTSTKPFMSYFNAGYLDFGDNNDVTSALMDELIKIDDGKRIEPLDIADNIEYGNRYYNTVYNLSLGDCNFVIPPEFISISEESNTQTIVALRQENSQKIKNGYSKKTISMDLVFHGKNQINGFQVEGPEGYYYVDGLRQLLAEFKCTPFLPVNNWTLNFTYNIWTVALQSIIVSTNPGYPNLLTAHITLQEVDLYPYLECHTMFYSKMIDWDLFRFYYQRQLTETNEYGKLQSVPDLNKNNKFKLSILNESIFDSKIDYTNTENAVTSFYDLIFDRKILVQDQDSEGNVSYRIQYPDEEYSTNFITYLDSNDSDAQISEFHCGYSNMLTNIQMAEMAHPTVQYMGGMDTNFQIVFETMQDEVVQKLESLLSKNNTIVRNHREYSGIGFIKLESELVQLMGTLFVVIDSISTSTVPGFPGLYNVQLNCITFDVYQKDKEEIKGHTPFATDTEYINNAWTAICKFVDEDAGVIDREVVDDNHPLDGKGIKSDAIRQSTQGLNDKIQQDLTIEQKMRIEVELYPDLKLPTYKEVDDVIKKIIKFRETHTHINGEALSPYPLTHCPRTPQRMLHGINTVKNMNVDINGFVTNVNDILDSADNYDLYVDPDFYVFYPDSYRSLISSNETDLEAAGASYRPATPNATTTTISKTYKSSSATDSEVSDVTDTCSSAQSDFIKLLKTKIGCPYIWGATGPSTFDCTGFIYWGLRQSGVNIPRFTTQYINAYIGDNNYFTLKYMGTKDDLSNHAVPGDILLRPWTSSRCGHVGVYIGDGRYIHAPSKGESVKISQVSSSSFTRVLQINALAKSVSVEEDGVITEVSTTTRVKYNINMNLKRGDKNDDVRQLQTFLNAINDYGLEIDGSYGPATEEAVRHFQQWYSENYDTIAVDGAVGSETSNALQEVLNGGIDKSSVEYSSVNNNGTITESELRTIARVIAKIQFGKPELVHYALAQLIYDRLTDSNSKYGTLNTILASSLFEGMTSKDIETSTAYSCVRSVFCDGNRVFPTRCLNYRSTTATGKAMTDLTELATYGEFTFYGDDKATSTKKFIIPDSDSEDSTITTTADGVTITDTITHGVKVLNAQWIKKFGRPLVIKTSEMDNDDGIINRAIKRYLTKESDYEDIWKTHADRYDSDTYNTDENILLTSFCNQAEYSGKGRLVKAFPTYFFAIVDDDGNWLDGCKLWANYYFLRSVVEIQTCAFDDTSIQTATITVTNSYGNLSERAANATYYKPSNDSEYNKLQRYLYETFGILPGFGPKLTEDLVERKNIIYNSMIVRAGSRMHLRMGYGSDPLSLPIVMNGTISDLSVGDIMSFVCVSDGVELTNSIISDNPKDTNGIFESQESSNMCIDLLTKRASWLNTVSDTWGEASKYGIEHFGLYFSEHVQIFNTAEFGTNILVDTTAEPILNATGTLVEAAITALKMVGDGLFKGLKTLQYDLIKNIYRSSYDASLAMYNPFWGFIDGEKNICYSQYNKTPWDTLQICAQNAPEYLGYPMYHQFESRLYFGLPYWMAKYRYDILNGELYEEAKAFAQVHFVDSLSEIIDNQMKCSGRNVFTNAIVMYTLGKSPKATPTLFSDRSMDHSKQSTKIFDSSVSQNIIGPDSLWEFIGYQQGKDGAVRLGISQLLINWSKAYSGNIIMLGDAGIMPNDYVYLNDRFNDITGMCTVRCVTHTLSGNTGFITTFTPGMIGFSALQSSSGHVVLTNLTQVGAAFSYYASIKKAVKENAERVAAQYSTCESIKNALWAGRAVERGLLIFFGTRRAINYIKFAGAFKNALVITDVIKDFKSIKTLVSTTVDAVKLANGFSKLANVGTFAKTAVGIFKAGGFAAAFSAAGTAVPIAGTITGFVIGFMLDRLLTKLIDYFKYKHCVNLLPMMRHNMSYTPYYGKNLLLTSSDDAYDENDAGVTDETDDGYGSEVNQSSQDDEDLTISYDE